MNTDKLQARIDRIYRLMDAAIEVSDQYGNSALNSIIGEMKIELERLENLIELEEDY